MFVKSASEFIFSACGTRHEDMIGRSLRIRNRKIIKKHGPNRNTQLPHKTITTALDRVEEGIRVRMEKNS